MDLKIHYIHMMYVPIRIKEGKQNIRFIKNLNLNKVKLRIRIIREERNLKL